MNITDKAILVNLSIGMPGNTRKDVKTTEDVKREKQLGKDAGKWLKQIFPDEALAPLEKLAGEIRNWAREHSLPWTDDGWRILPTTAYFEFTQYMRKATEQYKDLAESHFMARLPEWEAWARQEHNGTFNPMEYNNPDKLRRKFYCEVNPQPIPSGTDFRVQLSAEEMENMSAQVDQRVQSAIDNATKDLWSRLINPLKHLVQFVSTVEGKDRTRWTEGLIGNVQEIVALLPALNLTQDATLEAFRQEVADLVSGLSTQTIKEDKVTRAQVAGKAAEILKKMEGYAMA